MQVVTDAVIDEFIGVTSKISGIRLTCEEKRHKRIEKPRSAVVMSKGIFKSKVVCIYPKKFEDAVLIGMNDGKEVENKERQAYFKEYLNMCFGKFISHINNYIGKASRFVIPVIINGMYRESGMNLFDNKAELNFTSDYGSMRMDVYYSILPEHSSN